MTATKIDISKDFCPECGAAVNRIHADLNMILNGTTGDVTRGGETIRFTPTQFKIFASIVANYPKAKTKDKIHHDVYFDDIDGGPDLKIVDVFVCKMRAPARMLGLCIETIWGNGYRIKEIQNAE